MKQSLYPLVWIVSCVLTLLPGPIQAQGQQTCFPSTFGPNDQVGNLHHVTPEKTLAAAKLITRGKAYRLGIETNKHTPAFPPRTFSLTVVQPGQVAGNSLGPSKTTYNDDIICGLGRHRLTAGRARPCRHRQRVLQLQQGS